MGSVFWSVRFLLPVCRLSWFFVSTSCLVQNFWMESPLYVQFVSTSYLVQNVWIESPCMFNLSVLHIWFKTWIESPCMSEMFKFMRLLVDNRSSTMFSSGGPDYFLPDLKFLSWKPTNEIYTGKKVLFFQYVKCPIRISAKQLAIWQTIHFHVDIHF